jgi:hypothetical protein
VPEQEAPALSADGRALVVLVLSDARTETLAEALSLSRFEAEQYARRGGWQVHRLLATDAAQEEAARLGAAGIETYVIPEEEIQPSQKPRLAEGGLFAGSLVLRTDQGPARVRPQDVRLVVEGAIQRERQKVAAVKGPAWSPLEPGFRFHLHTRDNPHPVELDPASFTFDEPVLVAGSSLLELRRWSHGVSSRVTIDDAFRFVAPALGLAATPARPDLVQALGAAARSKGAPAAPPILDNLAQFRFYSGWRAAVERRRRKHGHREPAR